MSIAMIFSAQPIGEQIKGAFRAFGMALKNVSEKAAVVAVHVLESIAHAAVAAPLTLLAGNTQRAKLHFACAKVALYCLYSYSLPRANPYSEEFRFHHISYGLFFALLPGRLHEFGKWMTFDTLVNYDQLAIFQWREGRFVVKNNDGSYGLQAGRADGILERISQVTIQHGKTQVRENAFPADNFFGRHHITLLKEMFLPWQDASYLDAVVAKKNQIIDTFVLPGIEQINNDSARRKPKINIDFSLFK